MKKSVYTIGCLVIILIVALISGCTKGTIEQDTIKIGVIAPLTGNLATLGINDKNMVEMAAEEINANGGINGRMIELIYEDGQCNGEAAITAGNKLINMDQVNYIVGGLCSPETLAVAPIAEAAKVVMISPCSSNPSVTNAGDYIFRDYPSDLYQGKYAAEYVYNTLGVKKVAIISCLNDYCTGISKVFSETFEEMGGEITSLQEFEMDTTDLRTQLTKVKEEEAELIYAPVFTETAVNMFKQAKELGVTATFLGGDIWDDPIIWESTKGYSDGALYTVAKMNEAPALLEKYQTSYNTEQGFTVCALNAYDALNLFAKTIAEVGDDPTAVKDALYLVQNYPGASGTISFDSNGDITTAAYNVKIVNDGVAITTS